MSKNLIIYRGKRFENEKQQKAYDILVSEKSIRAVLEDTKSESQLKMGVQHAVFFGTAEDLKHLETEFKEEAKKNKISIDHITIE